jgi:hypothetical protein
MASIPSYDLKKMEQNRLSLIQALNVNPKKFVLTLYNKSSGLLASPYLDINDPEICCLIQGEQFKELDYNTLPPVCNSGKLSVMEQSGKTSQPYLLTVGDKKFVLKIMRSGDPSIEYSTHAPSSSKNIIPGSCNFKDLKGYSYIASDEFTNEFLIGYMLDYVFKQFSKGIKSYVSFHTATICTSKSFFKVENYDIIMMEYCDLGSLNNIGTNLLLSSLLEPKLFDINGIATNANIVKPDALLNIYKQVMISLDFLQDKVQFTHGDLKIANILLKTEQYATNYKNINISSPFTVKLADFGKSSMTMILSDAKKPFRFYNHSSLASKYYVFTSFKPKVNTGLGGEYYIIDNIAMSTLYSEIRHMGIPFYATFDTYTFIISFLLVPEVFRSVFSNEKLKSLLWDPLWFPGDSDKVYRSLVRSIQDKEEHTMGNVLKILKNIKLKCNITANIIALLAGK